LHYSGRIVCLGTLIHERFILNAAHCGDSGGFLKVRLGEYGRVGSEVAEDYTVSAFIKNRNFNPESQANSIGLVKLIRSVQYKEHIRPVCILLDSRMQILVDELDYFTGTAWMYWDRKLSSKTVDRMPQTCGSLDKSQFCAGKKDLEFCEEPSGSALTHQMNYIGPNRTVQFGIANLIETNCSISRVFTDVVSLYQWIGMVVNSQNTNDGIDEPPMTSNFPVLRFNTKRN